jgi:hypothetical protein
MRVALLISAAHIEGIYGIVLASMPGARLLRPARPCRSPPPLIAFFLGTLINIYSHLHHF